MLHSSLNPLGGAERVALASIHALKRAGHEVTLVTYEKTDWNHIFHAWGETTRPDNEQVVRIVLPRFTLYKPLLMTLHMPSLRKNCDLIYNTHGDVLLFPADITYMHYPTFVDNDAVDMKYRHGFWRIYAAPYMWAKKRLLRRHAATVLLANSRYTHQAIKQLLGRDSLIVYPPVDVEKFLLARSGRRGKTVVYVGRFVKEKRHHALLYAAKYLPDFTFYLVGSVWGTSSIKYVERLKTLVEKNRLKNVEIVENAPTERILDIMAEASVYVHPMPGEHFGIAVVEAMAAGLVPVVHMSGGPWLDIVEEGAYGIGFRELDTLPSIIRIAYREYPRFSKIVPSRARYFSRTVFERKIVKIVEGVARYAGVNSSI